MLWPELWRYKRNGGTANYWKYFCSWGCLRKYDKGREQNTMLTDEQKRKAAYMAYNGENPLPYLKQCGMSNPTSAWQTVRKWARGNLDQHEYEKLPVKCGDMQEKAPKRETVELVYDPEIAEEYRREQEQKKANEETRAAAKGRLEQMADRPVIWRTTAISNDQLGEFYYDRKYRTIDWRNPYGDEVSMPPEDWARLSDMIPQILHVLGAEVNE